LVQYDAKVLQQYAQRLYDRASWILVAYLLMGLAIGGVLGYVPTIVWYWRNADTPPPSTNWVALGALSFGCVFGLLGRAKGFAYRVKAQAILCQMQIEYNTRPLGPPPLP
jgi:hypothetical protein